MDKILSKCFFGHHLSTFKSKY